MVKTAILVNLFKARGTRLFASIRSSVSFDAARLRRILQGVATRADPIRWARVQAIRAGPFFGQLLSRSRYLELDQLALSRSRRSNTVFVFGSGSSLNELGAAVWQHIARHDTFSVNYFVYQRFVRVDYHLIGELATGDDFDGRQWAPAVADYLARLAANPLFDNAILGLQQGWPALQSNRIVASGRLPPRARIFRYRRTARGVYRAPSESLSAGLVHGAGTMVACVNLAYLLGWTTIVLAGVDLYDTRYFWLPADATRVEGLTYNVRPPDEPHVQAEPLVGYFERWAPLLRSNGVRLTVLNPRSLLARVLPVYVPDDGP